MTKGWKITVWIIGIITLAVTLNRGVFSSAWLATLTRLEPEMPNATEHVFEATVEEVKEAAWKAFDNDKFRGLCLYGFGCGIFGKHDIDKMSTHQDHFVLAGLIHLVESYSYRRGKRGLTVDLTMRIYLDSLAPQRTRARVVVESYLAETGWIIAPGLHFYVGPTPRTRELPPTTIEEHQALRVLGRELGQEVEPTRMPRGLSEKELQDTYYNRGVKRNKWQGKIMPWEEVEGDTTYY